MSYLRGCLSNVVILKFIDHWTKISGYPLLPGTDNCTWKWTPSGLHSTKLANEMAFVVRIDWDWDLHIWKQWVVRLSCSPQPCVVIRSPCQACPSSPSLLHAFVARAWKWSSTCWCVVCLCMRYRLRSWDGSTCRMRRQTLLVTSSPSGWFFNRASFPSWGKVLTRWSPARYAPFALRETERSLLTIAVASKICDHCLEWRIVRNDSLKREITQWLVYGFYVPLCVH